MACRSFLGGHAAEGDHHHISASPSPTPIPRRVASLRHVAHVHGQRHGNISVSPSPGSSSGFLLENESHSPMTMRGQGVLVNLIRNRSTTSLHCPVPQHVGWRSSFAPGGGDEETGEAHPLLMTRENSLIGMDLEDRRMGAILQAPNMRSMRLIGNSNPRYRWAKYWRTEEELSQMRSPIRKYYERTNYLVQQYLYIDHLLDSSLPHDLLNEYNDMPSSHFRGVEIPSPILEAEERRGKQALGTAYDTMGGTDEGSTSDPVSPVLLSNEAVAASNSNSHSGSSLSGSKKVKRTPRDIYRPSERKPFFKVHDDSDDYSSASGEDEDVSDQHQETPSSSTPPYSDDPYAGGASRKKGIKKKCKKPVPDVPFLPDEDEEHLDSGHRIVTLAIYINFVANIILLAGKVAVIATVPSMSVLASLVDAVLDFLSTAIVWTTTRMISHHDQYRYPVGRRRLEPLGVLVFSIIMITSFVQVGLESLQRLAGPDHSIIELGTPAIVIMVGTIVIKGCVWLWCRLIKNSSVRALAEDAMTDIIFNTGSIVFPIVGFSFGIWWLDATGGLILSLLVIKNWSQTSAQHIKNLSGFSATADQRNVCMFLFDILTVAPVISPHPLPCHFFFPLFFH